jgi:gliding motility-associated-like protein
LGIPNYFTPNGDGFNDTWNLKGANETLNVKTIIQIFDRYGKLIKQISPVGEGWNGTFNGQQMPATDYWYSIQLEDGRIIKGHFALKR